MKQALAPGHPNRRISRETVWFFAVAFVLSVLLLANMVMIFLFSAENREESGDRSAGVTEVVVDVLYPDLETRPIEEQVGLETRIHHAVRKLAHMAEFALLGWLSSALLLWLNRRLRIGGVLRTMGLCAAFGLLYAISDEVHQIFSNRGAAVQDVFIDFSGVILGVCLMHGLVCLYRCIRRKKDRKGTLCKPHATT